VQVGPRLLVAAVAACFTGPTAQANPTGPSIAAGAATFQSSGGRLTVTNTPGTILNWQSFSIGAAELTRFQQQSSMSAVLNRVVGGNASGILGQLQSNGRVFLVNPHGIVFGAGSVIDTAGFVASTLNIADRDFLAGRLKFEGGGNGALRNEGAIKASGDIFLIGPRIENAGLIRSDSGSVLLVAGQSVTITSPDAHGVQFALQAPTDSALNLGTIEAKDAAGLFAGTLRHSGDIRLVGASLDAVGRVILVAQKDAIIDGNATISADNTAGKGGSVQILGERVGLLDRASVSAQGAAGGGEILVGGDYRGQNSDVRNALATYIGSNAAIDASATQTGDGGKVIVWSNEATRVHGSIAARGGLQSGNGGFIETSSKGYLEVTRAPDVAAPAGKGGSWLLDPWDIIIDGTSQFIQSAGTDPITYSSDGTNAPAATAPSHIAAATIQSALNVGTSVIVDTAGAGGQAGSITVNSSIAKTAGADATLSLLASSSIDINADITSNTGKLNMVFAGSTVNLGSGTLNANGGTISAPTATLNVTGSTTINSPISIGALNMSSSGGTIVSGSGDITVNGLFNWSNTGGFNGFGGSGALNVNGGMAISGTGLKILSRTLTLNSNATWDTAGTFRIDTGQLSISAGQVFDITASAGGQLTAFTGPSSVLNSGTFKKSGGAGAVSVNNVTFANLAGGLVDVQAGTLTLDGAGVTATTHAGTFNVASGKTLEFNGNQDFGNSVIQGGGTAALVAGAMVLSGTGAGLQVKGAGTKLKLVDPGVTGAGKLVTDAGTTFEYAGAVSNTFGTTGAITLNGQFDWTGAANFLSGSGTFDVNGGMAISGAGVKVLGGRTLTLNSNATWDAAGTFRIDTGQLNIAAGSTFDITGSAGGQLTAFSGPSSVLNSGTFKKSAGVGAVSVNNLGFSNLAGATVDVQAGTLSLDNGSVAGTPHAGTFTASTGATFQFNGGTHELGDGVVLSGAGTLQYASGALNVTGATTGAKLSSGSSFSLSSQTLGGTGIFVNQGTLSLINSTISGGLDNQGTLNVTGTSNVNGATFTSTSGTIDVPAGQTLNKNGGAFDWAGGTLSGTGTYAFPGATFNVTGAGTRVLNGPTFNITTLTIPGGSLDVQGGTLNLTGTTTIAAGATLAYTGGTLSIGGALDNSGTLDINTGTVNLAGGGTSVGTFDAAGGSTINFSGGTHNLGDGSSLMGAGSFGYTGGTLNLAGTTTGTTLAAGTTLSANSQTFGGAGKLVNLGTFNLADSTVTGSLTNQGTLNASGTSAISNLDIAGGSVTGTGTVTSSGTVNLNSGTLGGALNLNANSVFNWLGGTMDGTGTTTVGPGAALWISGAANKEFRTRTLTNNGVGTWLDIGAITRTGGTDGTFNNAGTLDIQTDAGFTHGIFNNTGTLTKSAGALSGQPFNFSNGSFNNSGTVNVNAGALNFAGGCTQSAGSLVLAGGNISGNLIVNGGTLGGAGMIAGNVTNNSGALTVGASPGTLTINGNYTQGATGVLNVELGGTVQGVSYDLLQVTGAASLNGTLNVSLFGGFVPASGNTFGFMTYASRTGDFATLNLPASPALTPQPNTLLYQLAVVAPLSAPATQTSTPDAAILATPANDTRTLNDNFLLAVTPDRTDTGDSQLDGFSCR
jgi:filamentous hemagglutinin family protein